MIGCLRCQTACAEDRPFRRWVERGWEFFQEETSMLLEGLTGATIPPAIQAKLDTMGLIEFFGLEECLQMLSRKLAILTSRL